MELPKANIAWSTQLIAELEIIDQQTKNLTAGLTVEQLNWQPAPGVWSIGQCLEHLCLGNEAYLPAMSAALNGKAGSPVQEITPGWFARWFIRSFIEPSAGTKRASAPKKIVPGNRVALSIVERFLRGNQDARQLIRQAEAYNVNRIRFVNPFLPLLRFTVGTGLKITCGHERRHLLQAERVKQSPGFPHESIF
jgi:hypothetical protein